jgi:hypothetical protein
LFFDLHLSRGGYERLDLLFYLCDLFVEILEMALDELTQSLGSGIKAVVLASVFLNQVCSALIKGLQLMVELILPLEAPRLADARKLRNDSGIDGIGLGQMALASGVVAHTLWEHHGRINACIQQGFQESVFIAAGGLDHRATGSPQAMDMFDDSLMPMGLIGDRVAFVLSVYNEHQVLLGNIDS